VAGKRDVDEAYLATVELGGTESLPTVDALSRAPDVIPQPRAELRALEPGAVLNARYTVRRALGRGGMGWVYDVEDALFPDRPVALKTVHGLTEDNARLGLFRSEFRTMTKLDHPNVARVYDLEQVHGFGEMLITMERVDGEPIHHAYRRQAPSPEQLVGHIVQICRALNYIHSRRVVHYDLKPANILLCADGTVKVVDFGLSGADLPERGDRVFGTPQYMAPELLLGDGGVDHRADLYALGITLYELAVGSLPCPTRDVLVLMQWIQHEGVHVPLGLLPEWLARVIEKLCQRRAPDRYPTANAVIVALNAGSGQRHELETSATTQSYILSPRFTGRDAEYANVVSFVARRAGGRGGAPVLTVRGLSGMGKSRLMREARHYAQLSRIGFFESSCYEGSLVEHGPWADLLVQVVPLLETLGGRDAVTAALPEAVRMAPDLARGRSYTPAPKAATVDGERAQLFEAVAELFVQAARHFPLVLYVNDLQWAGRGAAHFFAYLAQRVRDDERAGATVRLGLCGSYRSDEVADRPLADTVRILGEQALNQEIQLAPLDPVQVGDVLRSMLGIDEVPEAFRARVASETGGNPFFVQEVMRVLFDNGSVFLDEGRWATKGRIADIELPATIADVFRRRFAHLRPEEKQVTRMLAVNGRPMQFELLAAVLGGASEAMEALHRLEDRAVVVREEGRGLVYNMAHDRLRETVYGDLPPADKRALHRRIGERLDALCAPLDEAQKPLDELARHFRAAEAEPEAYAYARRAGVRAMATYAYDAAVLHLGYVMKWNDEHARQELEIAELHADALLRIGDTKRSLHALTDALRLAKSPEDHARLHGALSKVHFAETNHEACLDEGWRAVEALGGTRPKTRVGAVLRSLRAGLWLLQNQRLATVDEGSSARARALAAAHVWLAAGYVVQATDRVLMLYTSMAAAQAGARAGPGEARALARLAIGTGLTVFKDRESGMKWLDAALAEPNLEAFPEALGTALAAKWGLNKGQGPLDPRALSELKRAAHLVQRGGSSFLAYVLALCLIESSRAGAWSEGLALHTSTLDYARRSLPMVLGDPMVSCAGSLIHLHATGDAQQAVLVDDKAIATARAANQENSLISLLGFAPEARSAAGDPAKAVEMLEETLVRCKKMRFYGSARESVRLLPRLYLAKGPSCRDAQAKTERVLRLARALVKKGFDVLRPHVALGEAQLLESCGHREKADTAWSRALATALANPPARFYIYDILQQRGVAMQRRGERKAAQRDLEEARAMAVECGDRYVTRLCEEALAGGH
jgi:serine/threonine protein kinase